MENSTVKTRTTTTGFRFLLTPEDSSASPSGDVPPFAAAFWNEVKTLLWLVFSVLAALLVGQL
jgi:hypothetical protein